MNKKILSLIIAASLAAISSCKDDKEEDLSGGGGQSTVSGLYINEVASQPNPDNIELYNSTGAAIDLGGYILQDDKGAGEEYIIPAGTMIPANSVLLFAGKKDNPAPETGSFEFGLSSGGDKVVLFDNSGAIVDEIAIPAMTSGSYARATDGGATWVYNESAHTLGASNASTPIGGGDNGGGGVVDPMVDYTKLIVNEVFANGTKDAVDPDWVEIYNSGAVAIDLDGCFIQDVEGKASAKRVIKAGVTVAAGGYVKIWTEVNDAQAGTGSFGLSTTEADGVTLFAPDETKIDRLEYPVPSAGQPKAGKSWGRYSGGQGWMTPSPAVANTASTAN
ncbi:MAG: lamin tail domain-containing protein [Prevotellaceae bacterium]|nr:lamin tail domain-containing protein [Prevotellaceae bacterium]